MTDQPLTVISCFTTSTEIDKDETDDEDISEALEIFEPQSLIPVFQTQATSVSDDLCLEHLVSQVKVPGVFTEQMPQICAAIMSHPKLKESDIIEKFEGIAGKYAEPFIVTLLSILFTCTRHFK